MATWCINSFNIKNTTSFPQFIYVYCIYITTNTDFCLIPYKLICFLTQMKSVYCAVRTESLNKTVYASSLKG
jgi:hypothetical protein